MSKSTFADWFDAQHGTRQSCGRPDLTDSDLLSRIESGLEAKRILEARTLWDAKRTSALYAWQAATKPTPTKEEGHTKNLRVGFWSSEYEPYLPIPVPSPRPWQMQALFCTLLSRLQDSKAKFVDYRGFSLCRCCGRPNGNREFTYGHFTWPEGLLHYVVDHNITPPSDFIAFVLNTGKKNHD